MEESFRNSAFESWTPEEGNISSRPSEAALIDAVTQVYDPEIPVNIYELGLIYAIEADDDGHVTVEMTLTAPGCPSAQELPEQVHDVLAAVSNVKSVEVKLVWDPWLHFTSSA